MRRLGRHAHALVRYTQVMQTPIDFWRYLQLRRAAARQALYAEPRALRLRSLGGAEVLCRPTQDVWTFKHTFLEGLHRPPVELPACATIVDLGSNVGYTVADLAYRYPSARVIGVEMDRRNFDLARLNTGWLGSRVEIVHAAAWTSDGEISYAGEADDAFAVTGQADGTAARTAPAKSLNTLFAEHGVERVDYVKMDIEGAEGAVLSEAIEWLDRVRAMKIEIHAPVSAEWCRGVLETNGFRCWFDERHWNCVCAVRD